MYVVYKQVKLGITENLWLLEFKCLMVLKNMKQKHASEN